MHHSVRFSNDTEEWFMDFLKRHPGLTATQAIQRFADYFRAASSLSGVNAELVPRARLLPLELPDESQMIRPPYFIRPTRGFGMDLNAADPTLRANQLEEFGFMLLCPSGKFVDFEGDGTRLRHAREEYAGRMVQDIFAGKFRTACLDALKHVERTGETVLVRCSYVGGCRAKACPSNKRRYVNNLRCLMRPATDGKHIKRFLAHTSCLTPEGVGLNDFVRVPIKPH